LFKVGAQPRWWRKCSLTGVVAVLALASVADAAVRASPAIHGDWVDYLGGPDSSQFSPLAQIDRANVAQMAEAWRFALPDNAQTNGNPLVIAGRIYLPSSAGITALDAASGRQIWHLDASGVRMRGLSSWVGRGHPRRIFYTHQDRLHAIDARTGAAIRSFGQNGSIDLKQGLDRDPASIRRIESQSPGRVFGNLIILGSTGGDDWNSPPGHIRAYDVLSGRLVWIFHTIPYPGEANYEEWPKDAWKTVGGVNNWSEMTLDVANGILFVPLASANYDFYGVNRRGSNLYANSLVALDARTGKRLWHFQTVHHDIWDYDLPQAPKLLTLRRDGKRIEAVAVATKTGYVFTFERRTGRPVFPIEERPVPQTDVEGEWTSPTQPFPTAPPPFSRQRFTVDDLSPYLPQEEAASLRAMLAGMRNEGPFTPPSLRGTITMPGTSGGTNWGNGAVDAERGRFYVVSMETPSIIRLQEGALKGSGHFLTADGDPGAAVYAQNCAACHGEARQGQPPAIPGLIGLAERRKASEVREVVRRGRATMPGFELTEGEMSDLLTYLGFKAEPSPPAPAAPQPPAGEPPKKSDDGPVKYKSGYNFVFSKLGLPANAPPWATLTAYDLNAGTILWQVPFGDLPMMKGVGSVFPRGTIVATAGGLIIAANQDRTLRAWDVDTGKVVYTAKLPSTPGGVPAVYMIGGRQYIAVPVASYDPQIAKGVSKGLMPEGMNSLVTYALPPAPAR
jgi:quinoprotein glucose dehydrogenase